MKTVATSSLLLCCLLACSSDTDEVAQGSQDIAGTNAGASDVLTCESYGAKLVMRRDSPGSFEAVLSGKAAELLRDEQGKDVTAVGGGYDSGKTWQTKKRLPGAVSNNFGSASEAPVARFTRLSRRESGGRLHGYFAGQYDPAIVKEATGYKAVVPYFEMTGSHTTMTYEYANWFFADGDCK